MKCELSRTIWILISKDIVGLQNKNGEEIETSGLCFVPTPRVFFSFKLVKPLNGQWFEKRYISIVYFIINNNFYRNVNEIDTVSESALPYVQSEKGPRLSKHPWYCLTSSLYWRWPRLWTQFVPMLQETYNLQDNQENNPLLIHMRNRKEFYLLAETENAHTGRRNDF